MSRIAFLMPTLNAQTYLAEAIGSLQRQSHTAFDLFVLDGGSTDATVDICRALQKHDGRITILSTPFTSPSRRINDALDNLPHDYLLMAHADDVSVRERAARQVAFMQQTPELVMSGCNTHFWLHRKSEALDINHYSGFKFYPAGHEEIRCQLPFWWSFSIPSLILNGAAVREKSLRFDDTLHVSSDWWFYWQATQVGRVANLQEPLISYRHHDASDGVSQRPVLAQEARLIRERIAREAGFWSLLSPIEAEAFLALDVESNTISAIGDHEATEALMARLAEWNAASGGFAADGWKRLIAGYTQQVAALPVPAAIELAATKAELATTKAELTATKAELAATAVELTVTAEELTVTVAELTATAAELTATAAELPAAKAKLAALHASRSWRATAPLRRISGLLSGRSASPFLRLRGLENPVCLPGSLPNSPVMRAEPASDFDPTRLQDRTLLADPNRFAPGQSPYYIVTPRYIRTSAGIKALHLLCHCLNRVGQEAFLVIYPAWVDADVASPELLTPLLTQAIIDRHRDRRVSPIVVYPETIVGNPLSARTVVRYLLNFPGLLGGARRYPVKEMIFGYSKTLAEAGGAPDQVLFIPASDTTVFTPPTEPRERRGSCFSAMKYRKEHGGTPLPVTADAVEITREEPDSPEPAAIAELFRRSEVFYTYENTALALEAALCLCPTVFLPNPWLTEVIAVNEMGWDGFAWGAEPAEIARAQATVHLARARYLSNYVRFWDQLSAFGDSALGLPTGDEVEILVEATDHLSHFAGA